MEKVSILTPDQKIILSEVKKTDFLKDKFYFTGGTVLAEYYLNHRYSDDLDFFSGKEFDNKIIFTLVDTWSKKHKFSYRANFAEVTYIFNLTFARGRNLKLDFSYYPYARIQKGKSIDGFDIDSLLDIAVNKLLVITQRTEIKDFVDLHFLLQTFSVWDLMSGVKVKFGMEIEPFILAADLLKIEDFDYLPKMIKKIDLETLKNFYRQEAQSLGKRSVS